LLGCGRAAVNRVLFVGRAHRANGCINHRMIGCWASRPHVVCGLDHPGQPMGAGLDQLL
jgi:hypothetical protein